MALDLALALELALALDLAAMSNAAIESLFEHDLIRKPVPTFRDHALASAEKTTGAAAAPVGKSAVFDNLKAYEL